MLIFKIQTRKKREVVDITQRINYLLKNQHKENGLIYLFALHTSCALTTADLDPNTDLDYLDVFEKIVPPLKYRHPHNPEHFPDHFLSSIVGVSLILPFENKNLILGTWQRLILIEFNGPKERNIYIKIID